MEKSINSNKSLMVKLFNKQASLFKFSNDVKWLTFRDSSKSPGSYIAMPVDSELPYFSGKPIYPGEVPGYSSSGGTRAMTQNPSGLVISECDVVKRSCRLKKWDFTEAEKKESLV